MTQLFPILVVAVVLVADRGTGGGSSGPGWIAPAAATVPVLGVVAFVALGMAACRRRLDAARSVRAIVTADRIAHGGRWALLVIHTLALLAGGWLDAVRSAVDNPILIDELIAIAPAVTGAIAIWWLHYPIERRLRESLLIRRLDHGRPIYGIPSRGRFVMQQTRTNLLLLLVPVLTIVALAEMIDILDDRYGEGLPTWAAEVATILAGLGVFLCAPLLARLVLTLERLGDGTVRDDLLGMCRRHGVRVREFLLWRTDGSMINAAVMGLVGRLRYVLLTDALLESMTREQVQAVMAHELGHVKRHHMSWLILSLIAALLAASVLVSVPFIAVEPPLGETAVWFDGAASAAAGVVALLAFGWVSRRYERQADTFAVQHLSGLGGEGGAGVVTAEAVAAMQSALEAVAALNSVDPRRGSWRHGSIAWRTEHLRGTVGLPLDAIPIDRLVRRMKVVVAAVLVLGAAAVVAWGGGADIP